MTYTLGIDVGTTFSAAAVMRGERVDIVPLGTHRAAIPSVVLLRGDDTVLTGEAAVRRAVTEPERVAREFKRRVGDTTPLMLGGKPQSIEGVTARLLRWIVDTVSEREGGLPDRIAITHPANWGDFKLDVLRSAVRMAGLTDVIYLSEPEAAAIAYAAAERVPDGAKVAVYDLGGGTFDAAVLERHGDGFTILGPPEGIERLGGIDFDAAVLNHVLSHLDDGAATLRQDPVAADRLRTDAVAAKEALSSDTDVTIPVVLPALRRDIGLTRDEFEALIRPALTDTVAAMRRALDSAGVDAADLHSVLLVGGSSRIPLVSEVIGNELGRPVAVDSHPKHVVAMGAARMAAGSAVSHGAAAAVASSPPSEEAAGAPSPGDTPASEPPRDSHPLESVEGRPAAVAGTARTSSRIPLIAGSIVGLAAVVVVAVLAFGGSGDAGATGDGSSTSVAAADASTTTGAPTTTTAPPPSTLAPVEATTTTTTTSSTTTTTSTTTTINPIPEPFCDGTRCITIDSVEVVGGELEIIWTPDGFTPNTSATHAHFYWSIYESNQVGSNSGSFGAERAPWELTAQVTFVPDREMRLANRPEGADMVCVTVANGSHGVIEPANYHCFPLPEGI